VPRFTLIAAINILSIFGASGKEPDASLPDITSGPQEGWHDFTFAIRKDEKLPDGSRSLEARGLYRGREVGVIVVLSASWPEAKLNQKVPWTPYRGVITYRSLGTASDSFLHIMDELYGTALHPKSMRAETKFTGLSLEGKPDELEKAPVKIKVFYESDDEQRYAELFTNIDLQHRVLQINEKDEEYRKPVVRALSTE
jgi:hypothetical protein